MFNRLATVWPRQGYTADKVVLIPIDIADPISQLVVIYEPKCEPPVGWIYNAHPAACISKIEIVDNGGTLITLAGVEAQGVDFYDREKEPPNDIRYLQDNWSRQIFNINFGRFLWDQVLALDPKKHTTLQLQITIDIDGGGGAVNEGYLSVFASAFDEKAVTPIGFLACKNIKIYDLSVGGHEYTNLPLDYPFRQIFLRAQRYGYEPSQQIANVKLTEDIDKKVPVNHSLDEIIRAMVAQWPPYIEDVTAPGDAAAQYYYCTPTYHVRIAGNGWALGIGGGDISFYDGKGGRFREIQGVSGPNFQALIRGHAPHGMVPILPKFGLDPAEWYDPAVPKVIKNLKLDITGGADVGDETAEIIIQQLRKY